MARVKACSRDIDDIKRLISALTGLTFSGNRSSSLDHALSAVHKRHGALSFEALIEQLKNGGGLINDVIEELLIHETYFFREAESLNALTSRIDRLGSSSSNKQIRLWCAGCSTGEEPYSLAIILLNSSVRDRFGIIATDLSGESLQLARAADYSSWSLRSISELLKDQHFKQEGKRYQLKDPKVKERVVFQQANLISNRPLPSDWYPLDAIVCRNVLIYFERPTIASVANIFFNSLAPGGLLLTGVSDPSLSGYAPFECHSTSAGTIYRRPENSGASSQIQVSSSSVLLSTVSTPVKYVLLPQESAPETKRLLESFKQDQAHNNQVEQACLSTERLCVSVRSAYSAGKWKEVVALLRGSPELELTLLVKSLLNLSQAQAALDIANAASNSDLLNVEAYFLQALALFELKDYRLAVERLKKVIFLDRSVVYAHFLLGMALFFSGESTKALKSLNNSLALIASLDSIEKIRFAEDETLEQFAANVSRYVALVERKVVQI